jgi:hypothetical protein
VKVGDLVAVKEISGTKLCSKRNPGWGVITEIRHYQPEDPQYHSCRVEFLAPVKGMGQTFKWIQRRQYNVPTEKQIPEHIKVEWTRRMLIGELV